MAQSTELFLKIAFPDNPGGFKTIKIQDNDSVHDLLCLVLEKHWAHLRPIDDYALSTTEAANDYLENHRKLNYYGFSTGKLLFVRRRAITLKIHCFLEKPVVGMIVFTFAFFFVFSFVFTDEP